MLRYILDDDILDDQGNMRFGDLWRKQLCTYSRPSLSLNLSTYRLVYHQSKQSIHPEITLKISVQLCFLSHSATMEIKFGKSVVSPCEPKENTIHRVYIIHDPIKKLPITLQYLKEPDVDTQLYK